MRTLGERGAGDRPGARAIGDGRAQRGRAVRVVKGDGRTRFGPAAGAYYQSKSWARSPANHSLIETFTENVAFYARFR